MSFSMMAFDGLRGRRDFGAVLRPEQGNKRVCGCRLWQYQRKNGTTGYYLKCDERKLNHFVSDEEAETIAARHGSKKFCAYLKPVRRGRPCSKAVRKAVKAWCGMDPGE